MVLIPEENRKDLAEIPDNILDRLDIRPVRWIDEVLELALQHMPVPRSDTSGEEGGLQESEAESTAEEGKKSGRVRAH